MDGSLGGAQNLRWKRIVLGSCLTAFGAVNGLAAAIGDTTLQVIVGVLSLLGLVVVAVLQFWEVRAQRSEQLETVLPKAVQQVRDLRPQDAGVAPEAPEALASLGRADGERYLARDVDDQLDAALKRALESASASLIVLNGPSKAGKTRTLFEAMRRSIPDANWLAPADAKAIDELMRPDAMPELDQPVAVLWLDDLELYVRVGAHGMHADVLERLSGSGRRWIVLATAGGKGISQAGDTSQFSIPMEDLLRHAEEIRLSPKLSAEERDRLQGYAPDAAERIAQDGIGEYMIAGRELARKLDSGRHNHGADPSPHGKAIAHAAIDWQRAGILDPIPRPVLRDIYAVYLPEHVDPGDADFDQGLDWARRPLYSTVALLSGRDEFIPYDYVVTVVENSGAEIEEEAWLSFLEASTPEQAFDLGALAFARSSGGSEIDWGKLAERANRKTMESSRRLLKAYAASNVGTILVERGDRKGAMAAYQQAEELGLGIGSVAIGNMLREDGDLKAAEAAYERADEQGNDMGAYNLGLLRLRAEDNAGAEAAFRRADTRGHDDAPVNLGKIFEDRGELDEAEAAYRRADERGGMLGAFALGFFLETARNERGDALAAYARADERGSAEGAFLIGIHLDECGDRRGAKEAFGRADERGDADGAYNLGILLYEDGELEEAKAAFRRADERGDAKGAYNHGAALEQSGELEQAEAAFRRADERGHPKASDALSLVQDERNASKAAEQDVGVGDQGGGDHQQDRGD
ncbi:MAG TPA: hypothetical protein VKC63_04655 [Solirubrobacterales bacterium]|nr:hypothetical protein [Solirubrobacterales bacterium]